MSTLLVDAGNARLKWASLSKDDEGGMRIVEVCAVELGSDFRGALEAFAAALSPRIDTVVVGNVAGRAFGATLAGMLEGSVRGSVWFARSSAAACGVRNAYVQPHTLGIDRWAAIVAAYRRARAIAPGRPVCVVDAGTALTVDAISSAGDHQGGLILPGLRLQREALLAAAADIDVPAEDPSAAAPGSVGFAHSTAQALASSGKLACAGAVDRSVRMLNAQGGGAPYVVLCGGDAAALKPWLETRAEICPNLVFEGLALLFEQRMCE